MEWLSHNPIADMRGPEFLLFYACAIVVTLAWCWWAVRSGDPSAGAPPLPVPSQPDPYEIAYLRGGESEVARLAVFNLIESGYLQSHWAGAKSWVDRREEPPDPEALGEVERETLEWFSGSRPVAALFRASKLPAHLRPACQPYWRRLHSEHLLMPPEVLRQGRLAQSLAGLLILVLGGYKLAIALSRGHTNVGFLILMAVVSQLVLAVACRPARLTRRGRQYLHRLQLAFDRLKLQVRAPLRDLAAAGPAVAAPADPSLLLLVGLFGVPALAGTGYDYYPQLLSPPASSSGCSSGTSSSSCSSSSCSSGSSCGGGGGCGGCSSSGG
jgi:uncharacterized protein (TIGR04222 family)